MSIDGLYMEFSPSEDRLLFKIHHSGNKEMLFWFTRRMVRMLWPVLQKITEAPQAAVQITPEARRAVAELKHDLAVQGAQFTNQPAPPRERPGGDTPVLITTVATSKNAQGYHVFALRPEGGLSYDVTLSDQLLHALIKLIRDAARVADWDLTLPTGSAAAGQPQGQGPSPLH